MITDHNNSHPNLPQMIGYSDDETPTPFILLANGTSSRFLSLLRLIIEYSAAKITGSIGSRCDSELVATDMRASYIPICKLEVIPPFVSSLLRPHAL